MDEPSFFKDPEKTKVVGAKGHVATRAISSPGRDNTTVLLCANAPPMIVYKGKKRMGLVGVSGRLSKYILCGHSEWLDEVRNI